MPTAQLTVRNTDNVEGGSKILDQVVADVDAAFRGLGDVVNQDTLITVTFTGAGVDTRVFHGLGHIPKSWEVVDVNAFVQFRRSPTVNADQKNTLLLQASAAPVTATFRIQ